MTIEFNVSRNNPGEFFACCGLFELANQLYPGAEAWFEESKFVIDRGNLGELLDSISKSEITNTMTPLQNSRFDELSSSRSEVASEKNKNKDELKELARLRRESPIVLGSPFNLTIDWFLDDYAGGSRFKTWAGQQSVFEIAKAMKAPLACDDWRTTDGFKFSASECGIPFNFDSDLGGQGGPIDVGFSFDPLRASAVTRIGTSARPVLELLAFIGLQRFRPTEIQGTGRFRYASWGQSLPISVAAIAATGSLGVFHLSCFEFRLLYRTKYLKSFLPGIQTKGVYDD
jgi:CRISPR-associated protein Csb3